MLILDIIKQSKKNIIMENKKSKFTIFEIIWSALTLLIFFKVIGKKSKNKN